MTVPPRIIIAAAFTALAGLGPLPAHAEKYDCSGSTKVKSMTSMEVIKPGDRPDRQLVQFVRVDTMQGKDGESEVTAYGHADEQVGRAGSHSGYSVTRMPDGEKNWSRWRGSHQFAPKGGGAWEVHYIGTLEFIGGTGKYKGIRGGGHYRGVATASGYTSEVVCDAEY